MKNTTTKSILFFILFFVAFASCKKESDLAYTTILKDGNSSLAKSDGIVAVQTSIIAPTTQRTFIAASGSSVVQFELAASKTVFLNQIDFTAPTGLVQSINGVPNLNGSMTFYGIGYLGTSGITLTRHINYGTVDAGTSGSIPQIVLTHIAYRTLDDIYHDFYPDGIKSQPMCLVNNLPHLQFQNPESKVLANGYKEIALVKLSGDTNWMLKTLPVHLLSLYDASIVTTRLIVKSGGEELTTASDSLTLSPQGSAQTTIKFDSGFQHIAGKIENLKIFAPVTGAYPTIFTTMFELNKFNWSDALGTVIPGSKNKNFFTESVGTSKFQ